MKYTTNQDTKKVTKLYLATIAFACGNNANTLALARFVIGLGASGGLIAAFKANAIWFPKKLLRLFGH